LEREHGESYLREEHGMPPSQDSPKIVIETARLRLAPLTAEDADEMAEVLDDELLHGFTGGQPATVADLRERYRRLAEGSPDPDVVWLNWIVRRSPDEEPLGTVQATLATRDGQTTAAVAWVIGVKWQGLGFATEAARALVVWLRQQGVQAVTANVHPDHRASAQVAARAGLRPTDTLAGGEQVWSWP
jgi:RimJ/RimL family protein N-acetyltransferase